MMKKHYSEKEKKIDAGFDSFFQNLCDLRTAISIHSQLVDFINNPKYKYYQDRCGCFLIQTTRSLRCQVITQLSTYIGDNQNTFLLFFKKEIIPNLDLFTVDNLLKRLGGINAIPLKDIDNPVTQIILDPWIKSGGKYNGTITETQILLKFDNMKTNLKSIRENVKDIRNRFWGHFNYDLLDEDLKKWPVTQANILKAFIEVSNIYRFYKIAFDGEDREFLASNSTDFQYLINDLKHRNNP